MQLYIIGLGQYVDVEEGDSGRKLQECILRLRACDKWPQDLALYHGQKKINVNLTLAEQQIPHRANIHMMTGLKGGGRNRKGSRRRLSSLSDNDSSASSSSTVTQKRREKHQSEAPTHNNGQEMNHELQGLIRKYTDAIRQANHEQLCSALFDKRILSEEDLQEIERNPLATSWDKNEILLFQLTKKSDQAFIALYQALRLCNLTEVAQRLEEEGAAIFDFAEMSLQEPQAPSLPLQLAAGNACIPPLETPVSVLNSEIGTEKKSVTNIINITNSTIGGLCIGDSNQQILNDPKKDHMKRQVDLKQQSAVHFLNSLLNPLEVKDTTYSRPYREIEDAVRRHGGFKQFNVGPLRKFIISSPQFKLSKDPAGNLIVEQVYSSHDFSDESEDEREESHYRNVPCDSDHSELEYVTCASSLATYSRDPTPTYFLSQNKLLSQGNDLEDPLFVLENEAETAWKTKHSHRKSQFPPVSKLDTGQSHYISSEMSDEEFVHLYQKRSPSESLDFKPSDEVYFCRDEGKAAFMEDIVSIWNTPDRDNNAHIIIGIEKSSHPPHKLIGISDSRDDADYQNLFLDEYFTVRPKFRYIQHEYQKMLFGIVIIPSSRGTEKPCITEKWHREGKWNSGEIWVKSGTLNKPLGTKHHDHLFKWFQKPSTFSEVLTSGKTLPSRDDALQMFLDKVDMFKKYQQFLLVLGRCRYNTKHLEALTNIHWFKVVDFDTLSRENGAFSVCEPLLKKSMHLEISTWKDIPGSLGPRSVNWFFPRGYKNGHDLSHLDSRDWIKKAGSMVDKHCTQIAEHCNSNRVLTVVILWYEEDWVEGSLGHLHRFMMKLDENVECMKVVFCLPSLPKVDGQLHNLRSLCNLLDIDPILVTLEKICFEIQNNFGPHIPEQALDLQLPHEEESHEPITIKPEDAAWLDSELEVLYLPKDRIGRSKDELRTGEEFLRGGQISWTELKIGTFDAKRVVLSDLLKTISASVKKGKSALIFLYHEPGSGGTTLGMRALWDLYDREMCACVYVSSPLLNAIEVFSRIEWLYSKTCIPVVVLIDGKDITQIHKLFDLCVRVRLIVLCVQRYNQPIEASVTNSRRNRPDQIWLSGKVQKEEAPRFYSTYYPFCKTEDKQTKLHELSIEVTCGEPHYVWEFGITVYADEFVGIQKYVEGYLQISATEELKPWQYVLGFLALAYFYGHVAIPAQFFAKRLCVPGCEPVTLDSLHSHSARQFIIEEKEYRWRINHVIVAKEILEQILSRGRDHQRDRKERLSESACQNLHQLAQTFIQEAGRHKMSPVVSHMINATFIQRNYKELSQDDNRVKKKMKHSQLLYDIPGEEKKQQVLIKLTACFPKDPSYWAHLGRYYGMKNPESRDAIGCLDKALQLRHTQLNQEVSPSSKKDAVLSQIYHMHGIIMLKRITARIGPGMIDEHTRGTFNPKKDKFEDVLKEVVGIAKQAAGYFRKCRDHHAEGMEESYGYVGEIRTLLHIIDFLQTYGIHGGYFGYIDLPDIDPDVREFLGPCFSECDRLLRECEEWTSHDFEITRSGSDQANLSHLINWFNALFKDSREVLKTWQGEDSIRNRRTKVAFLMMKHHFQSNQSNWHLATLEQIHCKEDIEQLIDLLQKNFKEVKDKSLDVDITNDVKKWLKAIRHPRVKKLYKISEVMEIVNMWNKISPNCTDAVFYSYIHSTLCAIGTSGCPGSKKDFVEADELLKKLKKVGRFANRYWRTREWLGEGKGIKRLVNHSQLGEWNREERFWKDASKHELLHVCTGTILSSKDLFRGTIALDTSHQKGSDPIKVFFLPKHYSMYGKRFEHQRVEFYLGFSMIHGCEAYKVCFLENVPCNNCQLATEVSRLNRRVCYCKKCNVPVRLPPKKSLQE